MLVDTDLNMAGYSGDSSARNAKAHDRCYGNHSWRKVRGIDRLGTISQWKRQRLVRLYR